MCGKNLVIKELKNEKTIILVVMSLFISNSEDSYVG